MWGTRLRVVKPTRVPDRYNPSSGILSLDVDAGATVLDDTWLVECQPIELVEDDAGGTRVHTRTSWRIITRPGVNIPDLAATDGVVVDGIPGVLEIVGEVGRLVHPRLGHDEFTVRRWEG